MDLSNKIEEIQKKHQNLHERKIRLQERLRTEEANFKTLIQEIKSKGYDPKKLKQIKEEKEANLEKLFLEVSEKMKEAENILDEIEQTDAQ